MKKAASVLLIITFIVTSAISVSAQKIGRSQSFKSSIQATEVDSRFGKAGGFTDGTHVLLRWEMGVEAGNLGFYVYQVSDRGEQIVSTELIPGAAMSVGPVAYYGETYDFFVPDPQPGVAYFIEMVAIDGKRVRSEPFSPVYISSLDGLTREQTPTGTGKKYATGNVISRDLTLPKDLSTEVTASTALADPAVHRWAISRPGVKIGVRSEGFYRVSRAELQAGGFDVTSDRTLWQLYLNGVQQAITVDPSGNFIEFYARAIDTVESDINTYYLVIGDAAGKRIIPRVARRLGGTVVTPNYQETFVKKERTIYTNQIFNGEAENFFGRIITSSQTTLPFTLSGIDFASPTSSLTITIQGYSFDAHQIEMILNGNVLQPAVGQGRAPFSISQTFPAAWLVEGANSLQLRSIGPAGDTNLFDNLVIGYARTFLAQDNSLKFFTQNYKTALVNGFSSPNVRIYDITAPDEPLVMSNIDIVQRGATFGPNMPSARGRLFYAIEGSAFKSVFSVIPNDPALIAVPGHAADLVIIAHKNFMTQAEAWATYRRSQGFGVKVVNVEEIYDEFNYGVHASAPITSFLSYAINNWQTPPRYLLIIGDASYDPRNYTGNGYNNMVPTKFVTTIYSETGSDEGMADFNGDGLAELAVGRIAVRTTEPVTLNFNRVVAWEASLPANPLERGALFAHDLNNGYDFAAMSQRLRDMLPASMPATMISRSSPTAQTDIVASINTGKYLVNYVGHGSTGVWAATSFFSIANVPQLTNGSSPSIFTMLTCLNGFFINVTNDSLAEALIKGENGGAVAAWASTGLTTPDVQEIMASRFFGQVTAGGIPRMGDLVKDAKTAIPGGSDVRLSWVLIGDPMLKVR